MALKQATRLLNLKTPLGENELVLTGFSGEEGLSQLFRFELEMISDNNAIAPKDIVGKNVTFSVQLADESPRHFNGFVSRFSAGDEDQNGRRSYRAEVVPNFWFLTRNADCRIFENKTLKQIIEQVFSDRGLSDFKIDFKGQHAERVYCVQFRESDFNFLSRLMEEEGVWYAFKHEDGKHTMLIADKSSAYFDCQQKEADYPFDFGGLAAEDHIRSWRHEYEFRSGKVAQSDYNFETPSTDLGTNSSTIVKDVSGADKYELYDYPGYYADKGGGQPLADVRMEEEEVEHDVVQGTSLCRTFTPGGKFKIRQHRSSSEKGKSYVITTVQHTAYEPLAYETGAAPNGQPSGGYDNSFTCIPDGVNFRPQRKTRKPSVKGLQTAVVIGDDEIPTDKYGRVRVRFPWDRKGKEGGTGTCWVRVSQLWASAEWGGMHIPHKDDEVLVDFIDGDPDRPMIVGRVYNAERKVPLPLPDHKTKSIIRDYGNNEMIWEGKPGEQYVRINQECGNEMIMNGKPGEEGIQLRDKFGNQLYLDSANQCISLFSPSHTSGLVLGKSNHWFSSSNETKCTAGNTGACHIGSSLAVALGFKTGLTFGSTLDVFAGTKISATRSNGVEYTKGDKFVYGSSSSYARTAKETVLGSSSDIVLDADRDVWLMGGKDDKSVFRSNDTETLISFESGASGRESVKPPSWSSITKTAIGAGIAFSTTFGECIASLAGYQPDFKNIEFNGYQLKDGVADHFERFHTAYVSGLVNLFAGMDAKAAAKKKAAEEEAAKDFKPHKAPDGRIRLNAQGVEIDANDGNASIKLEKSGNKISLDGGETLVKSEATITIDAAHDIVYKAQDHNFKTGSITHKNITVRP